MPSTAPPLPCTGADRGGRASGTSGEGDGTGPSEHDWYWQENRKSSQLRIDRNNIISGVQNCRLFNFTM